MKRPATTRPVSFRTAGQLRSECYHPRISKGKHYVVAKDRTYWPGERMAQIPWAMCRYQRTCHLHANEIAAGAAIAAESAFVGIIPAEFAARQRLPRCCAMANPWREILDATACRRTLLAKIARDQKAFYPASAPTSDRQRKRPAGIGPPGRLPGLLFTLEKGRAALPAKCYVCHVAEGGTRLSTRGRRAGSAIA